MPSQFLKISVKKDQREREPDGVVVWDQKGIVVVWSDGHRSRFSWEALRRVCPCAECWEQAARQEVASMLGSHLIF
jgi:DUF971 family protein